MKKQILGIFLLTIFVVQIISGCGSSSAIDSSSASDTANREFKIISESFTDIKITDENNAISAVQEVAQGMGLENAATELEATDISGVNGRTYYRLQQMYEGIPVWGRSWVVAADSTDTALGATSNAMDVMPTVYTTPEISQEEINTAVSSYLPETYGISAEDVSCDDVTTDDLVIYNMEDPENPVLCYQLYAYAGGNFYEVLIDAVTGEILLCNSAVDYEQKEGIIKAGQKQDQSFTAKKMGDIYSMDYVTSSGSHIYVRIPNTGYEDKSFSYDSALVKKSDKIMDIRHSYVVNWMDGYLFTDMVAVGTPADESAVDAMTNTQNVFECFYREFGRNSFDGNGENIDVFVHSEANENNASYIGELDAIYVYKCHNEGTETDELSFNTIVMGHEFTHGIIAHSSLLSDTENNKMPQAINEAIADIMGYYVDSEINDHPMAWEFDVSREVGTGEDGNEGGRSSIDRKFKNNLFHYNEYVNYYNENGVYPSCHHASTIVSHAAYLMNTDAQEL